MLFSLTYNNRDLYEDIINAAMVDQGTNDNNPITPQNNYNNVFTIIGDTCNKVNGFGVDDSYIAVHFNNGYQFLDNNFSFVFSNENRIISLDTLVDYDDNYRIGVYKYSNTTIQNVLREYSFTWFGDESITLSPTSGLYQPSIEGTAYYSFQYTNIFEEIHVSGQFIFEGVCVSYLKFKSATEFTNGGNYENSDSIQRKQVKAPVKIMGLELFKIEIEIDFAHHIQNIDGYFPANSELFERSIIEFKKEFGDPYLNDLPAPFDISIDPQLSTLSVPQLTEVPSKGYSYESQYDFNIQMFINDTTAVEAGFSYNVKKSGMYNKGKCAYKPHIQEKTDVGKFTTRFATGSAVSGFSGTGEDLIFGKGKRTETTYDVPQASSDRCRSFFNDPVDGIEHGSFDQVLELGKEYTRTDITDIFYLPKAKKIMAVFKVINSETQSYSYIPFKLDLTYSKSYSNGTISEDYQPNFFTSEDDDYDYVYVNEQDELKNSEYPFMFIEFNNASDYEVPYSFSSKSKYTYVYFELEKNTKFLVLNSNKDFHYHVSSFNDGNVRIILLYRNYYTDGNKLHIVVPFYGSSVQFTPYQIHQYNFNDLISPFCSDFPQLMSGSDFSCIYKPGETNYTFKYSDKDVSTLSPQWSEINDKYQIMYTSSVSTTGILYNHLFYYTNYTQLFSNVSYGLRQKIQTGTIAYISKYQIYYYKTSLRNFDDGKYENLNVQKNSQSNNGLASNYAIIRKCRNSYDTFCIQTISTQSNEMYLIENTNIFKSYASDSYYQFYPNQKYGLIYGTQSFGVIRTGKELRIKKITTDGTLKMKLINTTKDGKTTMRAEALDLDHTTIPFNYRMFIRNPESFLYEDGFNFSSNYSVAELLQHVTYNNDGSITFDNEYAPEFENTTFDYSLILHPNLGSSFNVEIVDELDTPFQTWIVILICAVVIVIVIAVLAVFIFKKKSSDTSNDNETNDILL